MKKIAVLVTIMFCCYAVTAQTNLKKKIVDSTCACLSEIPDLDKKSPEELQMIMGQCMMKKSMEDFMALVQERNIEMTDMEGMQKLMAEISVEMAKADCKALNSLMLKMAQRGGDTIEKPVETKSESKAEGMVQNVEVKDFIYVTVLSGAKQIQLVWSDMVANGNNYAKDLIKLKGKTINFSYTDKEVYSIRAKAYISVKMITAVK